MSKNQTRKATQRALSREPDAAEITLPFRIVCTRRESQDGDSHPFEVRVLPGGKSLLEPRSTG